MVDSFNSSYREDAPPPPWDIGGPQPEIRRLLEQGALRGRALDVGCGTGENAIFLAQNGLEVVGVDGAPLAIEQAKRKAEERGVAVRFEVGNALDLDPALGSFDVAIDSGCFHVFGDLDRPEYVASVRRALRDGGRLYLICFSERQPGDWGPRRVTERELREAFEELFTVDVVEEAHFEIDPAVSGGHPIEAWLATMTARPATG